MAGVIDPARKSQFINCSAWAFEAGQHAAAREFGLLADPIDSPVAARILEELGLRACPQLSAADSARVMAVIAKGDAPFDVGGGKLAG
jgi:hypothetical protein